MPIFLLPVISGISNLLRLPALAIFLGQLAATILGWLATRITRSVAINLTVLTMVLGLALTTALALSAIFNGLSYVVPPELSQGFAFFMPDNAIPCISAIFSARVIRFVWQWQFYAITKVSS
ncbi:DUF5455 family protein [Vibrio rumoiensis]|uniref:DUF5455 family protein n=1 Tax=Vibrio rumoiensis TaxID=76258 RepID=UPI000B5CACFC|nr:DUF5455 family protein [Vibrio rumoiensis]